MKTTLTLLFSLVMVTNCLSQWSATGNSYTAGNVGLGTTTYDHRLNVNGAISLFGPGLNGTTYQKLVIFGDATNGALFEAPISSAGVKLPIIFNWRGGGISPLTIFGNGNIGITGNVGIGTSSPDAKLAVKGTIHTQEVRVDLNGAMAPDYVFDENYDLPSLSEVEAYIKANKHLSEIPSATEMENNGLNLKEMNLLLLKKVEELTLYVIELNRKVEELERRNQ